MKPHIDRVEFVDGFLSRIFAGNLHAKRIESLANGALGVMTSASLAVSIIGHSLAQARGLIDKHAIKQVDRLLSNRGVVVWEIFAPWVREVVGPRKEIVVAMDWTDFDADDPTTLALNLVTRHGRATPLLWLTVPKDELKDRRNDYEDLCLSRLAEVLPPGLAVTILADRGFGDTKLFAFLDELGFAYVIRFRGNIHVTAADGETRDAANWVGKGGRARKLRDAGVTAGRHTVGAVVCVHAKNMKEPWCLAASDGEASARNHEPLRQTLDDRYRPGMATLKILLLGRGECFRSLAGFAANAAGSLELFSRPRPSRDPPEPVWRAWSRRQRCGTAVGPSGPRCKG